MLADEFIRNAENIAAVADTRPRLQGSGFQKTASMVFDELATDQSRTEEKERNLLLMATIKPTKHAAVVAAAKNEGVYLLEWLAHHQAVGFQHAFIYTNDNTDGSDAILELLAREGLITHIRSEVGVGASPQIKAYEHSLHFLKELRSYEWAAYLDLDEFLTPSHMHGFSVLSLIDALKKTYDVDTPGALNLNWNWFGSEGLVTREPGLVQDRFTHAVPHPQVKSLVRVSDVRSMRLMHMPEMLRSRVVNSAFKVIERPGYHVDPPEHSGARVNHYYHKSYEEFGVKRDRGEGASDGGLTQKPLQTFFQWDIPVGEGLLSPVPALLRRRVEAQLTTLMNLPGMADVVQAVEDAYRSASSRINGAELQDHYETHKSQNLPDCWYVPYLERASSRNDLGYPAQASKPMTVVPDLAGDNYINVLSWLHTALRPNTYLEIGVAGGSTLALSTCASVAVDTDFHIEDGHITTKILQNPSMFFSRTTSDDFFSRHDLINLLGGSVEMAFLDGTHHCEVLLRDFANTERFCRRGSIIALHDCVPVEVEMTERIPGTRPATMPHREGWWTGDVWRTALLLKRRRPDLDINVIDASATGLVLVSNLSPRNNCLLEDYDRHVAEMQSWHIEEIGLDRLIGELDVQPTSSLATEDAIRSRYRL